MKPTIEDPIFKLPITEKAYALYQRVIDIHDLVPKRYRSYLWRDMYQQAGYVLYQLIRALKGSNSKDKKQALEKANEQLGMLQTTVYLIYHIKAISPELYQEMANSMNELGPMLGGFIRSIRT